MAYIGTTPKDIRSFGKAKFDFTATQGQTAFTGVDDDGKTLGFTDGQISVYVNGILMDESDYTTSGSNTVTLASPTNLNDVVSVVALQTDIPNSDYVPATGGTFTGPVTHTGSFTSQGIDDNANATAMTIDSSENVLVGKAATGYNTAAGTELWSNGFSAFTRDNATVSYYNRKTSDGDIVQYLKDGSTVGSIGTDGTYMSIGNGAAALAFQGANNRILPWSQSTNNVTDASLDLGNGSYRFRDAYLSGGVYLGGTGSANYLDDVERGTFSPSILGYYGNNPVITYNRQQGNYAKVGDLVHVSIMLDVTSASNLSSDLIMVGPLPFAISPGVEADGASNTSSYSPARGNHISIGCHSITQSYIGFLTSNPGSGWGWEATSMMPTGGSALRISMSYITA